MKHEAIQQHYQKNVYLLSPTDEVSRTQTSSLGGIGHNEDNQDWTSRYKPNFDVNSIISSRDPSIPSDDVLVRSYKKYIWYNALRFIIITIIMMIIAISRHYILFRHYDHNLCCFCYEMASKHISKIFEWKTCYFDHNIKDPNKTCKFNPKLNPQNLSTNYDLFSVIWYYLVTASIVFGIAFIYGIVTYCWTYHTNAIDVLLRKIPLEFMLSINVFISMICFYQIAIDYQFYPDSHFQNDSGKQCYIDSLNHTTEHIMYGVLITALVYIISPTILILIMHFLKNHLNLTLYGICERIYNWLFFGCCSIVILLFFGVVMFYTFGLILPHYLTQQWPAWIVIIGLQFLLFMSFIDIYNFAVFKYPRNPFMIIIKSSSCYKMCCRKAHKRRETNFTQIMNSAVSAESDDTFVQ